MKLFNNQNAAKFICAIAICSVMVAFSRTAKADTNTPVNTINTTGQATATAEGVEGFQLLLSAVHMSTHPGAVMCRVTLKNMSSQILYYPLSYPLNDYRFIVKNEAGKIVSLTQFSHSIAFSFTSMNTLGGLKPNQSSSFDLPVNWLYDMTKSGVYTVSVSREVLKDTGNKKLKEFRIISNAIQIERKTTAIDDTSVEPDNKSTLPSNHAIPPSDQWQVGDHWKIIVYTFRSDSPLTMKEPVDEFLTPGGELPGKGIEIMENYSMAIKVTDIQKVGTTEQVKLEFTPSDDAPSYVHGLTFQLVINRDTHQLLEANVSNHSDSDFMRTFNGQHVIAFPINSKPIGFPVDIIPQIDNSSQAALSTPYKDMLLSVTKSMVDGKQMIQESLSDKGKDWFRITQIWPAGSKWWSRYLKEDFDSQFGMLATTVGTSEIQWGAAENGLQLGISTEDILTNGSDPIHVKIALRNTSDADIPLQSLLLEQNLRIEAVDNDNNNTAVLTELGKAIQQEPLSFSTAKILPAHSTLYGEVTISNIDDMTLPGDYLIRASAEPTGTGSPQLTTPVLTTRVINGNITPVLSDSQSVAK